MTVGQFLINWMVRSAILTLAGAMLLRIFRVRDASIRLASWTAILCASAAIPMLSSVLPDLPVVVPRDEPVFLRQTVAEAVPARTVSESLLGFPGPVERGRAAGARPDASFVKSFDLIDAVVALYATISIMLLLRIGVGLAIGDRLRRRSTPTALNGVRESKEVSAPVTLGILWPAIVLPTAWREWDRGTLDAVLAHERSHVQHWDPAVQLLSTIHRALLWASPMSWFLHSKIVHAAEEASDDAAVSICDRAGYAEILLDFMTREARGPIWTGLQMARYGDPERRVLRILDESVVAKGVSKRTAALIIGVALPAAYLAAAATAEFAPRLEDVRKLPALQMPYTALPSVVDAGASAVPKKTRIAAAVPVLAQVASQNSAPVNGAPGAAEVRLTVSVTDSAGRYVSGLTAQNFRITAGQISPDISSFGLTDGEHSVVLLNTISGGDEAVNALRNVLDARDQMAVTAGPQASDSAMFWNAVLGAVNQAKQMTNPYKGVVVMMQGGSQYPWAAEADLARVIRAALHSPKVSVSFANIEDITKPYDTPFSQQNDLRIATAITGGRVVLAPKAEEVATSLTRIGLGLAHEYVLGFIPGDVPVGALGRPPKVEVVPSRYPAFEVIGPGGYYIEP